MRFSGMFDADELRCGSSIVFLQEKVMFKMRETAVAGIRDAVGLCCISIVCVLIGCFASSTSHRDRRFFWMRKRSAVFKLIFDSNCVLTTSIASGKCGMVGNWPQLEDY